jgi:hypothetical protein
VPIELELIAAFDSNLIDNKQSCRFDQDPVNVVTLHGFSLRSFVIPFPKVPGYDMVGVKM